MPDFSNQLTAVAYGVAESIIRTSLGQSWTSLPLLFAPGTMPHLKGREERQTAVNAPGSVDSWAAIQVFHDAEDVPSQSLSHTSCGRRCLDRRQRPVSRSFGISGRSNPDSGPDTATPRLRCNQNCRPTGPSVAFLALDSGHVITWTTYWGRRGWRPWSCGYRTVLGPTLTDIRPVSHEPSPGL